MIDYDDMRFIGVVVDVKDKEKAGRVKIRIYGKHDDKANVPDSDLPWARCVYPVTNAISAGVAGPTTGLVVGSVVVGRFLDRDMQIPIVEGTMGRSSAPSSSSAATTPPAGGSAPANSDKPKSDFPLANSGEDKNDVLKYNLLEKAAEPLKNKEEKTIGDKEYKGESIRSIIDKVGSIIDALRQDINKVKDLKRAIESGGVDQIAGAVSGFINEFADLPSPPPLNTTSLGNVVGDALSGALSGGLPGSKLVVDQITSITGIQFSSVNHLVGSVANRLAKKEIQSVSDAISRIDGSRFVMNNTMKKIENTLGSIKAIAGKKKSG